LLKPKVTRPIKRYSILAQSLSFGRSYSDADVDRLRDMHSSTKPCRLL